MESIEKLIRNFCMLEIAFRLNGYFDRNLKPPAGMAGGIFT